MAGDRAVLADRAALNAAFARHVARVAGLAAAYAPAATCPQGHDNWDPECERPDQAIGEICRECALTAVIESFGRRWDVFLPALHQHGDDPSWHPEWRIGPGDPKDFCGSLDLTVPMIAALGLRPRWALRVGFSEDVADYATKLVRGALQELGEDLHA